MQINYLVKSFTLLMLLVLLSVAGCKNEGPKLTDENIKSAIEKKLLDHPAIASNKLDVHVNDGKVSISGTVINNQVKSLVTEVVHNVKGVQTFSNDIVISASQVDNKVLLARVKSALVKDPVVESYEFKVEVDDNVVTLSGPVESWHEKDWAERIARGVWGVKEVQNHLKVITVERSDGEIKEDITTAIKANTLTNNYNLSINVNDGTVMVAGSVGSLDAKDQVAQLSWVTGVKHVDLTNLNVLPKAKVKDSPTIKTKSLLKTAVADVLAREPIAKKGIVDFTIENGTVTLTGEVKTLFTKNQLEKELLEITAVEGVRNNLIVRVPEDLNIKPKEEILSRIKSDPFINVDNVKLDVSNGTAILKGEVNSYFEKQRLEGLVSQVPGILKIQNKLKTNLSGLSDKGLKENILHSFYWNPHLDVEEIDVNVDDGLVTLKGDVENLWQKGLARELAFYSGAKDVRADLKVK